jgi:Holliday junction resolvase RusA-like endonuclease
MIARTEPLVELFAAGKPVPQPRAGPGKGGHMIMSKASHGIRGWRDVLRMQAQLVMIGKIPFTGPLRMEILFRFPRPKRLQAPHNINDMVLHDQKPDWDNVGKATDSFTGVIWMDDGQISTVYLRKRFALMTEAPGVLVRIYRDRIPWEN